MAWGVQLRASRLLKGWPILAICIGATSFVGCSSQLPQGLLLPDFPASDSRTGSAPSSVQHGAEGQTSRQPSLWGSGDERQPPPSSAQRQPADQLANPAPRMVLAEAGRDGVTLNLVEASIADAAKAVLGDILKVNYIIDSRVKGAVTVQTSRPVGQQAILDVLDAVLGTQGIRIVVDGELYKIVPSSDAAASGAPLRVGGGRTNSRLSPGVSINVVPLRYVAAPEMEQVLKSVSRENSILRVDPARNLLMLSGTRAEIASMLEVIDVFDVDTMRGMSFALFPVDAADPSAVAQELDAIFANDSAGPSKGMVRFVPSQRLRAVLVISPRADYVRRAGALFDGLKSAGRAVERQIFSYKVRNRPATELAQLLLRVYGGGATSSTTRPGAVSGSEVTTAPAETPRPDGRAAVGSGAPVLIDPGRAAPAGDPRQPTGQQPPGEDRQAARGSVSVVPDDANRMLLITSTREEYKRILSILARIDTLPDQVLIEATIAEITLKDQLRMGVKWFFDSGKNEFKLANTVAGTIASAFPGFSYFFNSTNIRVVLDALADITDVNIVSSPSLTVMDGKRATLQVGDEVPILTQEVVTVVTPGAPVVNSVIYRNTGVILGITPRINERGRIVLEIEQEVSDVGTTTSSTINSPTFTQRRIKTTVVVRDGESVALGGMMQDRSSVSRNQFPILGDIPYLGNLFKSKDDNIKRTELLIIITPRVMRDVNQARELTDEFRDRLNLTLRPQRQGPPTQRENVERIRR
jgi:general secretion pathway protein D